MDEYGSTPTNALARVAERVGVPECEAEQVSFGDKTDSDESFKTNSSLRDSALFDLEPEDIP